VVALGAVKNEQAGKANYGPINENPEVDKAEHGPFLATLLVVLLKRQIDIQR
jgi:hypothetical protein